MILFLLVGDDDDALSVGHIYYLHFFCSTCN
eukprot:COSAG02_NODE_14559_length_1259_cov_41.126724_1_plen_30_part_10